MTWEVITDLGVYFWGGIGSNWFKADIVLPLSAGSNPLTFNCVEQYMMAAKAVHFGDTEAYDKIMQEPDAKKQKALGRTVRAFDEMEWTRVARDKVYPGVYVKFASHLNLATALMNTGSKWIVEASPYDKIWGIGLSVNTPNIDNPATWQGSNWLGQMLMRARDDIRNGHYDYFQVRPWSSNPTEH